MATASSWMPAAGRHNVSIGSSLSKALKARKGQPPTQRSKVPLPDRDFYALRYNHKPASIDPAKPGTLEVNPGKEVTTVRVERPTVNNNEVIVFKGDEKPAKEWECVLIYDEESQTFTLEKLDSLVNLNFDVRAPPRTRQAVSPLSASSSSAAQTPRRSPGRTAADELEAQLEDAGLDPDADAEGEPDPNFSPPHKEEEEEEEEGEGEGEGERRGGVAVVPTPPHRSSSSAHQKAAGPPPPSSQPAQPQTKAARPAPTKKFAPSPSATTAAPQSSKAARASAAAASANASAPSSKPRPKPVPPATPARPPPSSAKRAAPEHGNDGDFEIKGPIAPISASATRRTSTTAAPSSVQGPSFGASSLALPTASAGPDPLAHQGLYHNHDNHNGNSNNHNGAAASSGGMESDEDWDEILAQPDRSPPRASPAHHHHGHHHQQEQQQETLTMMIDDEADDGLDFLARELLLEEDEPAGDGDGDEDEDLEEELIGHGSRAGGGPISMNQFAGGDAAIEDDDDDYSSSEESEED
ncbi:RNA polymerase II transcription elongation factor-domain-containing protein [Russula earlei]|uniref:RNA polymerase II transcription elongation factor-domain-containing protein n=1 Tax=Russula earlei TaxID=71964 RepID=A0ACC0U7L6_9AGAM|nr:RNA polymerase II transcription elongation factor-domain-containing protein [Russula earlei]